MFQMVFCSWERNIFYEGESGTAIYDCHNVGGYAV